jgi:hypothetical protein
MWSVLDSRLFKFHLGPAAFGECSACNLLNFGIQNNAKCDHHNALAFGDDTAHSRVNFVQGSQMLQRSTSYPVKMAALVICHVSLLTMLVWMSR